MNCMLCSGSSGTLYKMLKDRLYQAPGQWDLVKCSYCGFVWLTPPIEPDKISELYQGYYTHHSTQSSDDRNSKPSFPFVKALRSIAIWLLVRSKLLTPLRIPSIWKTLWLKDAERGSLLDVGCGNGEFLRAMRAFDWDVFGVEPDPVSSQLAVDKFGLSVKNTNLEAACFNEASFNVITMNHSLEHLTHPLRTIGESYRLLRPEGRLVIFTPNVESLGHYVFRSAWLHLDPPRHLFLFSPRTLVAALEQSGFRIEVVQTIAQGAQLSWCASRSIQQLSTLPQGWRQQVALSIRWQARVFYLVESLFSKIGHGGEEIGIIAIKDKA